MFLINAAEESFGTWAFKNEDVKRMRKIRGRMGVNIDNRQLAISKMQEL